MSYLRDFLRAVPFGRKFLAKPDLLHAKHAFNPRSYVLANPDLPADWTASRLWDHWNSCGLQEGRVGSGVPPYLNRRPWKGILSKATLQVTFYGPVSALNGLGSAARGYVAALSRLNINLEVIDTVASLYPEKEGSIASPSRSPDILILHQNPDSLGNLFRFCDRAILDGTYTIGIWVWEVMAFRPEWIEAFGAVDEIWTPSTFVTEAVTAAAPSGVPVRTIPHVVEPPNPVSGYSRSGFGIPSDAFAFLCVFDASSAFERKNPIAVLESFTEAFENDSATFLVMKFHSSGVENIKINAMRRKYEASTNILFIDNLLNTDELTALRQLTDCLVSAHRAEGFGLNIAEAMAIGKPVIATKYSGNLQFCNDKNSLLVSATLCEVEDGIRHYPAGVIWADPDHNELVAAMRRVVADPAFARSVGRQAAEDIGHGFGRERISTLIGQALEEIQSCVEPISQSSQRRSRLAWLHPGVLGSAEFTQGAWPTFSLIIPVHNTASSALAECIESMMAQTYPYWELCISDDASSDPQTIEYLEALRRFDQRISIRRLSERRGLPDAINAAVEITTGEFLMFIDPTGAIEPDRLATLAASVVANPHRALLSYNQDGSEADKPRILTVRKRLFLRSGGCGLENENADQDLMSRIVHATGPLS